ncbi:MAG: hypothetical protein WDA41_07360 [Candidatus Neomarinimicrobiota bacterium]
MLDRLIRREKLDNIIYGVVLQIEVSNKRVQIQGPNGMSLWASYLPEDFPDLVVNNTVAVGRSGSSAFVMRKLSPAIAARTTLLEI